MTMEALIEILQGRPVLTLFALTAILLLAARIVFRKAKAPSALPWVGRPTGPLAETRASYASFNNVHRWLAEGYSKVGLKCTVKDIMF